MRRVLPPRLAASLWDVLATRRFVSTRQAERLRRRTAPSTAATPPGSAPSATRPAQARAGTHSSSSSTGHSATTRARLTGSGAPKSRPAQSSSSTATKTGGAAPSSSSANSPKSTMPGRFNRLVIERGFAFTVYLYVLGESMTLFLAYCLHTHYLGIGDVGSWLEAVHIPANRYLNGGPMVYGVQLSPRLLLNYLVASACTYPLFPWQLRFVAATAPVLGAPFRFVRRSLKTKEATSVPKAPAAKAE